MRQKHTPITLIRGFLTLLLIPILIGLVSFIALLLHFFLRYPGPRLQFLPSWSGRMLCRVAGVEVTVRGRERLEPGKSYILAANHQSQFDIFVLQAHLGVDFRWLAKKELFKIPIFGPAMRAADYIPVDRSHSRRAVQSLDEAAQRIAGGTSVVIFPEGTRSPDGKLQPFKAGAMVLAIKAGVEVAPMAISGTYEVLPKGRLLARSGRVTVTIGEPIPVAAYHLKQKQELAQLLENKVRELLG